MAARHSYFNLIFLIFTSCSLNTELEQQPLTLTACSGSLAGTVILSSGDSAAIVTTTSDTAIISQSLAVKGISQLVPISQLVDSVIVNRTKNAVVTQIRHGDSRLTVIATSDSGSVDSLALERSPSLVVVTGEAVAHISAPLFFSFVEREIIVTGSPTSDSIAPFTAFCLEQQVALIMADQEDIVRHSSGYQWK